MHAHRITIFILLLLFAAATPAPAQSERWEPYVPRPDMTALRVWSSGDTSHARFHITFPSGGFRISEVGPVVRQGNNLSVDIKVERWTGASTQAIMLLEHFLDLGALPPGTYTFTLRSRGTELDTVTFNPQQVAEHWEETSLDRSSVHFTVWTAGGVTFTGISLLFPDDMHRVAEWEPPVRVGNDFVSRIRLERWTGRASAHNRKSERRIFMLGQLSQHETFTVSVQFSDGTRQTSFPFTPAQTARPAGTNPLDEPAYFVRQHYLDFLGREPDPPGLNFWYNEITNTCSPWSPACVESRRESVSASFFLSIEFQQTGFYVYRLHKAAYGFMPRFDQFMADTRKAAEGVIVNQAGWQEKVEENQRRFVEEFVERAEFKERYPETLTPEEYVNALDRMIAHPWSETHGGPLTIVERNQLADALRDGAETRATVLRKIADHAQFRRQEFNPAFVLMQYFGYLRRNPYEGPDKDFSGWQFWLTKLNQFGGNYSDAQMVRAFITSDEYRNRFPTP